MIQVDELHIRMHCETEEDGRTLGMKVAERLAEAIPEQYCDRIIPEIQVRLQGSASNDTTLMADRIAEQIMRQVKQVTQ